MLRQLRNSINDLKRRQPVPLYDSVTASVSPGASSSHASW